MSVLTIPRDPYDIYENIEYRKEILLSSESDKEFQQELWTASSRDILFWINTFVWTYDPRRDPSVVPFITYGFQDETITRMCEAMGNKDMLIEKSRDMGASWVTLTVFAHQWMFKPMLSFLMGSRKEEYVDKTGDLKGLFQKIDFIIEYLPMWMIPAFERNKLHLKNKHNGSTIDGESTNSDFARGDRRTAIFLDEFATVDNGYEVESATRDVTRCRIYNSTPKGTGNAFYDKREKMSRDGTGELIRMHWSEHPDKAKGLYQWQEDQGRVEFFDEFKFEESYPFIKDGKMRSVWYDEQCRRAANEKEIAQEIDIDYLGSGWQFFSNSVIDSLIAKKGRKPGWKGDVIYDMSFNEIRLLENEEGPLHLWREPDVEGKIPGYPKQVMACDVATGKGGEFSSNSVLVGYDEMNFQKIFEFKTNILTPEKFADVAYALSRHWRTPRENEFCLVCPEANGPGGQFSKHLSNIGHTNIYRRRNEMADDDRESKTLYGWWSTRDTKKLLLGQYATALTDEFVENYSIFALEECRQYVMEPSGDIVHSKAKNKVDPTATGENHGDCVIADALAVHLLKTFEIRSNDEIRAIESDDVPVGSKAWRDRQHKRSRSSDNLVWNDR
jgi:hypothetical protein